MIREVGKSLFFRFSKAQKAPKMDPAEFESLLKKFAGEAGGDPGGHSGLYSEKSVTKQRGFKFPNEGFSPREPVEIDSAADDSENYSKKSASPIENRLAEENSDATQSVMTEDTALKIAEMVKQKLLSEGPKAAFSRFNEISRSNAMVLLK